MSNDLIKILESHQNDQLLGSLAKEAVEFIRGSTIKYSRSSGSGHSSLSIAKIYKLRLKRKTKRPGAVLGLEESISSLSAQDVTVYLSHIETDRGIVAIWLSEDQSNLAAIVLLNFSVIGALLQPCRKKERALAR